ncbi:metallophosphoesterase [Flaviaesturariibacter flavus]|uniref:Metallophosphoesterase n=1 Tax=Flaviaesturariibacter flavus TaxID=2502780 RepID=A0A4R1BAY7_9BACT|nr:metallophosphoesterase [Flaviaesturariibacter flavus]TCJ14129.1 metallophosphoesterase [Flaviaesturariibacter flavus]
MRAFLRRILLKPVLRLSARYSSAPIAANVNAALDKQLARIRAGNEKKGLVLPFDAAKDRFIIFSDQHKGAGDGSDDFAVCAPAYLGALEHYNREGYHFVALGDSEELWENSWPAVKNAQAATFEIEKAFLDRGALTKIFGNHDLLWDNDPLAPSFLQSVYGQPVPIYEGVLLRTNTAAGPLEIFCTHGHQGDAVSDGNWFSKFFVARIWAPFQAWLRINPNTPAYDNNLKTRHHAMMYEWSARQPGLLLITGHTHQPVFESLTHIERLYRRLLYARADNDSSVDEIEEEIRRRKFEYTTVSEDYLSLKPSYFNSGCCCYSDGEITGIEIAEGQLRLVKWRRAGNEILRDVLEDAQLDDLCRNNF